MSYKTKLINEIYKRHKGISKSNLSLLKIEKLENLLSALVILGMNNDQEYKRRLVYEIKRRDSNFKVDKETVEELEDILAKLVKKDRKHAICWRTFVKCKKVKSKGYIWEITEKDLEKAVKEIQDRGIDIIRGDFVSFYNCPSSTTREELKDDDKYEAEDEDDIGDSGYDRDDALFIYNGKKLLKLPGVPDEDNGAIPKEFLCFDPKDFKIPEYYIDIGKYEMKDKKDCARRRPYDYMWMKPGIFLDQMQKNVNEKRTWFEHADEKYYFYNDFEDDPEEFVKFIKNLKKDTLLWFRGSEPLTLDKKPSEKHAYFLHENSVKNRI